MTKRASVKRKGVMKVCVSCRGRFWGGVDDERNTQCFSCRVAQSITERLFLYTNNAQKYFPEFYKEQLERSTRFFCLCRDYVTGEIDLETLLERSGIDAILSSDFLSQHQDIRDRLKRYEETLEPMEEYEEYNYSI